MNHAPPTSVALALALFLGIAAPLGCHAEHEESHELGEFLVTSPLRADRDLTEDYVSQIHSIQHIELRALERGYLQEVFVDEGQPVKKGQRMFQIMPTLYQAEYEKAQAEAEFTKIEYQNTKLLADSEVVSPNELALAKAKLDKARAELALSRVHRGFTEIRAPFDGIMGRLHVRRGSLLDEGELLTTLSDNSQMWVYFNVTEAEYLDYKKRAKEEAPTVQLVMANHELFDHLGKVETIVADFDHETGTIAFRATFPNPEGLLRHGETGKVLMTRRLSKALLVPQKVTFEVLDRKYVYVVEDGVVRAREITVTEELPHLYVVADGVTDDDKLLLEGLRKVKDGDTIAIRYLEPTEVVAQLAIPAE